MSIFDDNPQRRVNAHFDALMKKPLAPAARKFVNKNPAEIIDELLKFSKILKDLPEPISYIVLDHSVDIREVKQSRDKNNKKFLRTHPSVMDALKKAAPRSVLDPPDFSGIPIYKRSDMPAGWPDE